MIESRFRFSTVVLGVLVVALVALAIARGLGAEPDSHVLTALLSAFAVVLAVWLDHAKGLHDKRASGMHAPVAPAAPRRPPLPPHPATLRRGPLLEQDELGPPWQEPTPAEAPHARSRTGREPTGPVVHEPASAAVKRERDRGGR